MVKIVDLDSMIRYRLEDVTLNPPTERGEIPIFKGKMDFIASEFLESIKRAHLREGKSISVIRHITKYSLYQYIEDRAKLGALAAANPYIDEGNTYEFCCGIPIPSIAYSLLTRHKITATDKAEEEIERAHEVVSELGVSDLVDLADEKIKDVIPKCKLSPKDVVIISQPPKGMGEYMKAVLEKYEFNLIIGGTFELRDGGRNRVGRPIAEDILVTPFVEDHFTRYGYEVSVGASRFNEEQLVFLASKAI